MNMISAVPAALAACPAASSRACRSVLQVAVVGKPCFRLEVDADFDVLVFHLQCLGKTGQGLQRPAPEIPRMFEARQPQQCLPQLRREDGRQRAAFGGLDAQRVHATGFGLFAHAIQQHRLADAAQADHQHAFRLPARADALGGNVHGTQQGIAARQFGRRCACAGGIGVGYGVHERNLMSSLLKLQIFDKFDATVPAWPAG